MKIQKDLAGFKFLSDDTRDLISSDVLFVKTPQNAKYVKSRENAPFIEFENLADHFNFDFKLLGISGTNGKSTTAHLLHFALNEAGFKAGLIGTSGAFFGNMKLADKGLTTPMILELYGILDQLNDLGAQYVIMEVSSHAIVQKRCFGLNFYAKFLTNITQDHLDFHKDIKTYRAVKNAFLTNFNDAKMEAKYSFINADDNFIDAQNAIQISLKNEAICHAKNISLKPAIYADLVLFGKSYALNSALLGRHNLYNLLFCASFLAREFGDLEPFLPIIARFNGVFGRCEIVCKEPLVIVDFAHTPDGLKNIFESFLDFEIWALFGAGGDRDPTKRKIMGQIASKYCKKIYLTSDNPRSEAPLKIIDDILQGINGAVQVCENRFEAINKAISDLAITSGQKIVLLILGKGDESVQILKDREIPFDDREVARNALIQNHAKI
ncbi:MAG: UDP-N-acetylmuramoyl-L-alanyl-D-glutamate--2,6-diaminopimelate ligase [Helicobacter sp.]|nr:UDP-N-acetylmuramoyl-L-alanyl-D-glutamate--2,6-diaminopimelate ligase [Helicobacter sp.]